MSNNVNTKGTRTSVYALDKLEDLVSRANAQRGRKKKGPISQSKAIELAIKSLKVKDLVEA